MGKSVIMIDRRCHQEIQEELKPEKERMADLSGSDLYMRILVILIR